MKAIVVEKYGSVENLIAKDVPDPGTPTGRELLVRVETRSVNPVDVKVRAGKYDDYSYYYEHTPHPYQICGYDGAGTVVAIGPQCSFFKTGDQVFYSSSPLRHGSDAELQLIDERSVGHKPKTLDMTQAAAMPLAYLTAYEANRTMGNQEGKRAALLIINGSGGVGAVANQIARQILELPVVLTTASRPDSIEFTKRMGATHVLNHKEDLQKQLDELKLDIPLKYIFIAHSTDRYMDLCAKMAAPFGKICSIVQDSGRITCHLMQRLKMTLEGVREGHRIIERGGSIGQTALGLDEPGSGEPFI